MSRLHPGIVSCLAIGLSVVVSPTRAEFDADAYHEFLESVRDQTTGELIDAHAPFGPFTSQVPGDPLSAEYLDAIDDRFHLTEGELALLGRNGFMVSERLRFPAYGTALDSIWHADLPLFVSTDAILHAIHRSYVEILGIVERDHLRSVLHEALEAIHDRWDAADAAYGGVPELRASLDDVDVYLTVARSLLDETTLGSRGDNQLVVEELLAFCAAEAPADYPLFNDVPRTYDFSQLKPRGHYTESAALSSYFRAMMWLGRTEFRLTPPEGVDPPVPDVSREIMGAFLLREMMLGPGGDGLDEIDSLVRQLVGDPDNVTLVELDRLAAAIGLGSPADLVDPDVMTAFEDELATGAYTAQAINSQILMADPMSTTPITPPYAFLTMGQRFILDSFISGNVVFDRILFHGHRVFRGLPKPLDVLFPLGNDSVILLLQDELDAYHYASNLSALRYLIDGYEPDMWHRSLYTSWLQAIRTLSSTGRQPGVPDFMKTGAWEQQKMNTQLASWTELRHDNLLYAKQSYTGGAFCSYPRTYVEPVPDFYHALAELAADAAVTFSQIGGYGAAAYVDTFFEGVEEILTTLATIAEKELSGTLLTESELLFLGCSYFIGGCDGQTEQGWYRDLYFSDPWGLGRPVSDEDLLVADVHTQPTDEWGSPIGKILHGGTGYPELGVYVAAPPGQPLTAFVGPTSSFHEYVTLGFERLTDEEWADLYESGAPTRPDWTFAYLADVNGDERDGPQLVDEVTPTLPPDAPPPGSTPSPTPLVMAPNRPNPFNGSTVIAFRVANAGPREVTLRVYDVRGRRVAELITRPLASGAYVVRWAGTDDRGTLLESGTYVAELRMGRATATRTMTLVR